MGSWSQRSTARTIYRDGPSVIPSSLGGGQENRHGHCPHPRVHDAAEGVLFTRAGQLPMKTDAAVSSRV